MRSDTIKAGPDRAGQRALLKACGVTDADMQKPFIGVCNSYTDIVPGHIHLKKFAETVKDAVREAGGMPFEFNTIAVDDGIALQPEVVGVGNLAQEFPVLQPLLFEALRATLTLRGRFSFQFGGVLVELALLVV